MADSIPKVKVTNHHATGRSSFQKQEYGSSTTLESSPTTPIRSITSPNRVGDPQMVTPRSIGPLSNKKLAAKLRSPTSPSTQLSSDAQNGTIGEERQPSDTPPIDPLSQVGQQESQLEGTDANGASSHSKFSRERIHRPRYRSYERRTRSPQRTYPRVCPRKRMWTTSSAVRQHAMLLGARQTGSEWAPCFFRTAHASYP